jgi:hypothetical protein
VLRISHFFEQQAEAQGQANTPSFSCRPLFLCLKLSILPAESLNTPSCINQFLFTRKKGMAFGANFNPDILLGGPYLHHIAACTVNRGLKILWMDALLHVKPPWVVIRKAI